MGPWGVAAILGGAGLLKSELVDRPKEKRQRQLAAETQRYSPWTGLSAQPIQEADPWGSVIGGGATGLSLGQSLERATLEDELKKAQIAQMQGVPKGWHAPMVKGDW